MANTSFLATAPLISDDLDEVLALGDRIAVLHDGRLTAAKWSRDSMGLAMAGLGPHNAVPTPRGRSNDCSHHG